MVRHPIPFLIVLVLGIQVSSCRAAEEQPTVRELTDDFETYSGAKLVFTVANLPKGKYHDSMPELAKDRRIAVARIACREIRKLPPGYLGAIGLQAVGIFERCISIQGDGFRAFDERLGGYRYYGIYNGSDAVAAAYYSDEQLPLTLHHEIFHHIDRLAQMAVRRLPPGKTEGERLTSALNGEQAYAPPPIAAADMKSLKRRCDGDVLETTVGEYAAKNAAEDKAETARHLMSTLADSLVQVVEHPELPGSQRLLHVLNLYDQALAGEGPGIDWFVDAALGRSDLHPVAVKNAGVSMRRTVDALVSFAHRPAGEEALPPETVRRLLAQATTQANPTTNVEVAAELATAAAAATHRLLTDRICPEGDERRFVVMGQEDADGVNWTLRHDLEQFGQDAERLREVAECEPELLRRMQLKNLRLIARWYVYIASRWRVTAGTLETFERARARIVGSLPENHDHLAAALAAAEFRGLAEKIKADGDCLGLELADGEQRNRYLKNVDEEITDHVVRSAIRRVQPACVRLSGGSGVNVAAEGCVLTAGHVAGRVGASLTAEFPDGRRCTGNCVAFDKRLDLALIKLDGAKDLPFASLAADPPVEGTPVVCIGQPASKTPDGEATEYQPFHVSTGEIRGFLEGRLGNQALGRTKHDAWTYWGHSGSPLFNQRGEIVAMHNSWDSKTAMRHAVTYEAIKHFLADNLADVGAD
jgi:hypothetical protein